MQQARIEEFLRRAGTGGDTERERTVRDQLWATLRRAARRIPFAEDVAAGYHAALDTRTPVRVRGTMLAALAYFVLPIDMIPDFVAGIGFTDDVAVLTAAIAAIRGHITDEHRVAARRMLGDDPA